MFILFMKQSHDTLFHKVFDGDFSRDQFFDPREFSCSHCLQHLRMYTVIRSSAYSAELAAKICNAKKKKKKKNNLPARVISRITIKFIFTCGDPSNTAISRNIPRGRMLGSAASRPCWLPAASNATSTPIPFVAFNTASVMAAGSDLEGSMTRVAPWSRASWRRASAGSEITMVVEGSIDLKA